LRELEMQHSPPIRLTVVRSHRRRCANRC
jgi:hypothetical protein